MTARPLAAATDAELLDHVSAMDAALSPAPPIDTAALAAAARAALNENLNHIYCCDENRSLCGTDIAEWTVQEGCEIDCVVCAQLADADESCGVPGCPDGGTS